jgi:serine protease Do
VILSFDGKDVPDSRHLPRLVAETPIDHEVQVKLWRDGKEIAKTVKVAEMPEAKTVAADEGRDEEGGHARGKDSETIAQLGLGLSSITPDARQRYRLGDDVSGVLVTNVAPDSIAEDKQLSPGDVIIEVSRDEVKTPKDVIAKIDQARKANKKSVLLLVHRQAGDTGFVALPIAKSKG